MAKRNIAGLTIICHAASGIDIDDDPSYGPFKLEAQLAAVDGFMIVRTAGTEVLILRALTLRAIREAIGRLSLRDHPRLLSMVVTGPDGEIERIE